MAWDRLPVALYLPLFVLGWLMGQAGYTRALYADAATSTGNAFTTAASFDRTPPTVTATSPAHQAENVNRSTGIQVTFSEPMDQTSVFDSATPANSAFCLFLLTSTCAAGRVSGTGSWSSSGTTFTFDPTSDLSSGLKYRVTIGTGAKDLAGNSMAAAYAFTFQTSSGTDTAQPQVSSHTPASGGTDVSADTSVTLVFNEAMDRVTTAAAFCLSTASGCGGTAIAGSLSWSDGDRVLSFTPSARLGSGTNYLVRVCGSADSCATTATDQAGNTLLTQSDQTRFGFTTAATGTQAAQITAPTAGQHIRGTGFTITGTAGNNNSTFKEWRLKWGTLPGAYVDDVKNSGGDAQRGDDSDYPNGVTNGTLGSWNTTLPGDGQRYLTLEVRGDAGTTVKTEHAVVIDNTAPTVSAVAPTAATKANKRAGQSVTVDFTYTETNPALYASYTIRVCSDGSSETSCNNTKIGEKTFSGSLAGGTDVPATNTVNLSAGAANGSYDLRVTVADRAGNTASDREIGAVVVQSTASLSVTADQTDLAPGQSTPIRATVLDGSGNPLSGQLVSFSKNNACAGSLLSPTMASTGLNGEAITTLTVCSATFTSITVAASTTVGGTTLTNSVTIYDPPLEPPPDDFTLTAGSIKLAWKPALDPRVAGYRIDVGTASGKHTKSYDARKATSYTIEEVVPGTTYYLVLRSYDEQGRLSPPTREGRITLPGSTATATATATPTAAATGMPTAGPAPSGTPTNTPTPTPTPTLTGAVLRTGHHEDRAPAIRYSGAWEVRPEERASGGAQHVSSDDDAAAEVAFEGRSLTLIFSCGPHLGRLRVLLDGRPIGVIDQRARTACSQREASFDTGGGGRHLLRIEAIEDRPITLDALKVSERLAPVPTAGPTLAASPPASPTRTPEPTKTPAPAKTPPSAVTAPPASPTRAAEPTKLGFVHFIDRT